MQGPLNKGQFVFANFWNTTFKVRAGIAWPRPVETMWQACLAVDPSTQRAVVTKGVGSLIALSGTMDFLFSSPSFRVKCNYHFTYAKVGFEIKSHGTFIIDAREAKVVDAVLDAYAKRLAATKG